MTHPRLYVVRRADPLTLLERVEWRNSGAGHLGYVRGSGKVWAAIAPDGTRLPGQHQARKYAVDALVRLWDGQ